MHQREDSGNDGRASRRALVPLEAWRGLEAEQRKKGNVSGWDSASGITVTVRSPTV